METIIQEFYQTYGLDIFHEERDRLLEALYQAVSKEDYYELEKLKVISLFLCQDKLYQLLLEHQKTGDVFNQNVYNNYIYYLTRMQFDPEFYESGDLYVLGMSELETLFRMFMQAIALRPGKYKRVTAYKDRQFSLWQNAAGSYREGLQAYQQKRYQEAETLFSQAFGAGYAKAAGMLALCKYQRFHRGGVSLDEITGLLKYPQEREELYRKEQIALISKVKETDRKLKIQYFGLSILSIATVFLMLMLSLDTLQPRVFLGSSLVLSLMIIIYAVAMTVKKKFHFGLWYFVLGMIILITVVVGSGG